MKKISAILAAPLLLIAATASASITNSFNPAVPLNVLDQGGFTGEYNPPNGDPFVKVRLRFLFNDLNPSPLGTPFQISGISLKGPGITTNLSFSDITILGNGGVNTGFASLNNSVDPLSFATSTVSFNIAGGTINDGASFEITLRYESIEGDQVGTSTGVSFEAVPEPSTYALLALTAVGWAAHRWRQRSKSNR